MPETPRRAKIVCTMGPASWSEPVLRRMIRAGMDVARLNFSHNDGDRHLQTLRLLRRLCGEEGRPVAVLQDLQGPKVRVGPIPGFLTLRRGKPFTLTTRRGVAEPEAVSISYRHLPGDVKTGDLILLDDGRMQVRVTGIRGGSIRCRVLRGGKLTSRKGINIPGRKLSLPALTAKDRKDLEFGIEHGVDWIALSFVREARDVDQLRRILDRRGKRIPIVAKLEKPQAVENLDAILETADGIMVARGDLGVELPPERVPVLQKRMIRLALAAGKPVITATQMLESMVENARPTRAEASDVANAIFDGTDAVMLSAETAVGKHPVETVRMMSRIIANAEASRSYHPLPYAETGHGEKHSISDAIAEAAVGAAHDLGARVLAVFTQSGSTARIVAKYRPLTPVFAFTPVETVARELALIWGVKTRRVSPLRNPDSLAEAVVDALRREKRLKRGDLIVLTGGTPLHQRGSTNFLKIHRVP